MKYSCDECIVEDGINLIKCKSDGLIMYVCDSCLNSYVKDDYIEIKCSCGSKDIVANQDSPKDRPYIILTEYKCNTCKSYWYEEY